MPLTSPSDIDPTHAAPAKRERRKEARPGELIEAALELFVEKGYAATRVEEVAARAGVSKGTLFLYFASKEELFKAVVRHNLSGRYSAWSDELTAYPGNTGDMLTYCMQIWWEHVGTTKASGIAKLMLCEAGNFPELARFYQDEVIAPGQALIRRIFERGIARGEFRVVDLDYAVYSVVAPMVFLMLSRHSPDVCVLGAHQLDPQKYIASQLDMILLGLRTAASA